MKSTAQILKNIMACPKRTTIYNRINPKLFDVSLRDGIQAADKQKFSTEIKKGILRNIINEHNPTKIEVGSLVNPKLLPIMGDSLEMYNYASKNINTDVYMLIPSMNKLFNAFENNVKNFSFITSVSDQFQIRNAKRSIHETKYDFELMFSRWFRAPHIYKTKLYISCIDRCPILGKIDNDFILKEVLYYHQKYDFDELCLSDTMGTMVYDDFEYIIDNCLYFGIPPSKLSFHFHVLPDNLENLEKIIFYCFSKRLNKFDVSMLESGGCSVTMAPEKLRPNMTYDVFYRIMNKYIERFIALQELYGLERVII
jgi:hydroxymethylglutaryl-CoA lyase